MMATRRLQEEGLYDAPFFTLLKEPDTLSSAEDKEEENEKTTVRKIREHGGYSFMKRIDGRSGRSTYKASNPSGKSVALKVKHFTYQNSKDLEIACLLRLNHENVVELKHWYIVKKSSCIVLEFKWANSNTLFNLMQRDDNILDEKVVKEIFIQILSGLSYAHKMNICHRDLKLDNIFVHDESKTVSVPKAENLYLYIIGDWGFSTFFTWKSKTLTNSCGSMYYASPEIFEGCRYVGPEVDMWSLGVILYILLTKRMPFIGQNALEIKENVVRGIAAIPEDLNISNEIMDLLRGLLNLNPVERLTCKQVINHQWLNEFCYSNDESSDWSYGKEREDLYYNMKSSSVEFQKAQPDSPLLSRIGDLECKIEGGISCLKKEQKDYDLTCSDSRDFFKTLSYGSTERGSSRGVSKSSSLQSVREKKLCSESRSLPNVRENEEEMEHLSNLVKPVQSSPENTAEKKEKKKRSILGIFKRRSPRKKK